MARLLTHHDPYHMHAVLGLMALLHFTYRLVLCPVLGWTAENYVASMAVHLALALSALNFHVPVTRNATYEMLLHAIVFSLRSIIVFVWGTLGGPGGATLRLLLVLLCHGMADVITSRYGSPSIGTTIRRFDGQKSAYESRPLIDRLGVLAMSVSQLIGIWFLLTTPVADTPRVALAVLLPVQGSAFTATLVRKGKLASYTGGIVYMGQLALAMAHFPWSWTAVAFIAMACVARFRLRANKYIMWAMLLGLYNSLAQVQPLAAWEQMATLSQHAPDLSGLYESLLQRAPDLSGVYHSLVQRTEHLTDMYQAMLQRTADLYVQGNAWLQGWLGA